MDQQNQKCVIILDEGLPLGLLANTAAILGITLGKKMPETVGPDVTDRTGSEHLGIIEFPVPIPVSYTHLDVYKRQVQIRSAPPRCRGLRSVRNPRQWRGFSLSLSPRNRFASFHGAPSKPKATGPGFIALFKGLQAA